ncbi:hypothetical protein L2E82_32239 [Cichorium intybus]|uniref:Uncharacterized protein n=1 Tax=Cichorium intybus TaxID=13427 RepID=A0ACB9BI25_CICIN|nr:hypothetical protein L2E82_32239 [Cichorium intybus]
MYLGFVDLLTCGHWLYTTNQCPTNSESPVLLLITSLQMSVKFPIRMLIIVAVLLINTVCMVAIRCPDCGKTPVPYPFSTTPTCGHQSYKIRCDMGVLKFDAVNSTYPIISISPKNQRLVLGQSHILPKTCVTADLVTGGLQLNSSLPFTITQSNTVIFFNCTDASGTLAYDCTPASTLGYMDPDYYCTYQLTDKSDVYSYGVLLLEILTGQRAIDFCRPTDDVNLAAYIKRLVSEEKLVDAIDPSLKIHATSLEIEAMKALGFLAMSCLEERRENRPSMKEACEEIEYIMGIVATTSEDQS